MVLPVVFRVQDLVAKLASVIELEVNPHDVTLHFVEVDLVKPANSTHPFVGIWNFLGVLSDLRLVTFT